MIVLFLIILLLLWLLYINTTIQPFVPVEDNVVPTHASHTNKMNNMIGNVNSSQGVGKGLLEVVVPSDYYQYPLVPTDTEKRWPSGSILPDYIYE